MNHVFILIYTSAIYFFHKRTENVKITNRGSSILGQKLNEQINI